MKGNRGYYLFVEREKVCVCKEVYVTFIDLEKALDRANWEILMSVLK